MTLIFLFKRKSNYYGETTEIQYQILINSKIFKKNIYIKKWRSSIPLPHSMEDKILQSFALQLDTPPTHSHLIIEKPRPICDTCHKTLTIKTFSGGM